MQRAKEGLTESGCFLKPTQGFHSVQSGVAWTGHRWGMEEEFQWELGALYTPFLPFRMRAFPLGKDGGTRRRGGSRVTDRGCELLEHMCAHTREPHSNAHLAPQQVIALTFRGDRTSGHMCLEEREVKGFNVKQCVM